MSKKSNHMLLKLAKVILKNHNQTPIVVGISGTPGSGKSTLSQSLKSVFAEDLHKKTLILSLDDFYKTKHERKILAKTIHPLFLQRGVPGTHDLLTLESVFSKCLNTTFNKDISAPKFSKTLDDRLPKDSWHNIKLPFDIIFFEGWCVGAKPETDEELLYVCDEWENQNDPTGMWRKQVNIFLKAYQSIFEKMDFRIHLKVNDWNQVIQNRKKQEELCNKALKLNQIEEFLKPFYRIAKRLEDLSHKKRAKFCVENLALFENENANLA